MKTWGTHWETYRELGENTHWEHDRYDDGWVHPHLQIWNVGMWCVHSYNLCVCVKQNNEKFLGRIQLRNTSKVTFENRLQSVRSNWGYESKTNNIIFLVRLKEKIGRWHTRRQKPIFESWDDSDSKCEGKGSTLFPSLIPWWGSRTQF
jgi:hypothetical protein